MPVAFIVTCTVKLHPIGEASLNLKPMYREFRGPAIPPDCAIKTLLNGTLLLIPVLCKSKPHKNWKRSIGFPVEAGETGAKLSEAV
jgi:hypothetical protein